MTRVQWFTHAIPAQGRGEPENHWFLRPPRLWVQGWIESESRPLKQKIKIIPSLKVSQNGLMGICTSYSFLSHNAIFFLSLFILFWPSKKSFDFCVQSLSVQSFLADTYNVYFINLCWEFLFSNLCPYLSFVAQ